MDTRNDIVGRGCMVAVPYYGSLIRPKSGLETLYLMAEVDRATGGVGDLQVRVWNTAEDPDLPGWLKAEGIEAIFCSDFQPRLERPFHDQGISPCWNHEGGMEEAVRLLSGVSWRLLAAAEGQQRGSRGAVARPIELPAIPGKRFMAQDKARSHRAP